MNVQDAQKKLNSNDSFGRLPVNSRLGIYISGKKTVLSKLFDSLMKSPARVVRSYQVVVTGNPYGPYDKYLKPCQFLKLPYLVESNVQTKVRVNDLNPKVL